ncbi:MAG: hypothetical protein IT302_06155 [Dehalococcoidia bacterium]|nr:hypothetical protein [Dehalococcoidia bacterium]
MSPMFQMSLEDLAKSRSPRGYFPGEAEPDSLYRQAEVQRLMKQLRAEPAPAKEQAPRGLFGRLRFAFGR